MKLSQGHSPLSLGAPWKRGAFTGGHLAHWGRKGENRHAQVAVPTSAGVQGLQGPCCWALAARRRQPVPEEAASVLLHGGVLFHNSPLHLQFKCVTQPHPKVKRGHLLRHIQTGCPMKSVRKCLPYTVRA